MLLADYHISGNNRQYSLTKSEANVARLPSIVVVATLVVGVESNTVVEIAEIQNNISINILINYSLMPLLAGQKSQLPFECSQLLLFNRIVLCTCDKKVFNICYIYWYY